MTCVAWDGETLSADNQTTSWDVPIKTKKVFKIKGHLVGSMGECNTVIDMIEWFKAGAIPKDFPATASGASKENKGWMIVVTPEGVLQTYTRSPNPFVYGKNVKFAFGSGMNIAIGAMAAGKTSKEACLIAGQYNIGCGFGVSSVKLDKPKKTKKGK